MNHFTRQTRTWLLVCIGLSTACLAQAMPPDGGIEVLQAQVQGKVIGVTGGRVALPHPGQDNRQAVATWLAAPLTADVAVRIALLNNPGLQATMAAANLELTDLQAANTPGKRQAQHDIVALSARTFKAWAKAVAARQSAQALRDAKATAEATGELARRMVRAGNLSKLGQVQYQDKLSDAAIALARAEQAAFAAREQLIQLMGLWGDQTRFELPDTLPALPESVKDMPDLEAQAVGANTELAVAAFDWQLKRTPPASPRDLWDIMGDAASVRALAVKVRSEVRSAWFNYRSSYDIAQHLQTEVLPLRKFIHDEMTLRYNGMLTSVFDVLADSQTQALAQNAAINAACDFWLAHADLQAVLAGAPLKDTP